MEVFYRTSFEDGFYDHDGISEVTCPIGWIPTWIEVRPEYDAKDTQLGHTEVYEGRYAANLHTRHKAHDACLYRRLKVGAGLRVRASVWCMNVSNDGDDTDGGHGLQVGLDPTGGTDFKASHIRYGDWWSSYMDEWEERKWVQVDTECVSEDQYVTVFLHSQCNFDVNINAAHWDKFVLEVEGGSNGGDGVGEARVRELAREEISDALARWSTVT